MRNKIIPFLSLVALFILLFMVNFTSPIKIGAFGVLVFFTMIFMVLFGLMIQVVKIFQRILKDKNGAKYLYDFCDQVRNEKQVQYLMSVDVLEKEKIDNIKNKILPKLKKYINQQEKNKNKDYER